MEKTALILRGVAPLCGLAILVSSVKELGFSAPLFRGFRMPMIALELVENVEEVRGVEARLGAETVRRKLHQDTFVFVPVYTLIFLALSQRFVRRGTLVDRLTGVVLGLCALGTASSDLLENARTVKMLGEPGEWSIARVRGAALAKWTFLCTAMGLMAAVFLRRGGSGTIAGVPCGVSALVGAIGVTSRRRRSLIEWSFALCGLALVAVTRAAREI